MDEGRESRGGQEIDMEKMKSLFQDAMELSTSFDVNVGIFIFSPPDDPYAFFSPNLECFAHRFLNRTRQPLDSTKALEAEARARIDKLTKEIEELEIQGKAEEERAKKLEELGANGSGDMSSLMGKPFEELNRDELLHLKSMVENFIDALVAHSEKLKRRAQLKGEEA